MPSENRDCFVGQLGAEAGIKQVREELGVGFLSVLRPTPKVQVLIHLENPMENKSTLIVFVVILISLPGKPTLFRDEPVKIRKSLKYPTKPDAVSPRYSSSDVSDKIVGTGDA